ncbi:MAG: hypothetical protein E7223_04695 [Clostridiales bacterium]|nr:hypothetical protein [Clostridiales bacterium]
MNKKDYQKGMEDLQIRKDLGESIVKALQEEDAKRVWAEELPGRAAEERKGRQTAAADERSGRRAAGGADAGSRAARRERPFWRRGRSWAAAGCCCLALLLALLPVLDPAGPSNELADETDRILDQKPLQAKEYKEIYEKLAAYDRAMAAASGNNRVDSDRAELFGGIFNDFNLGAKEESAGNASAPGATGGSDGYKDVGASDSSYTTESGGGSDDHSGTNLQVEGIDEADIIKTDGKYLYILSGSTLVIAEAKGAETRVLSKTVVGQESYYTQDGPESGKNVQPVELFVAGDRLILITNVTTWQAAQKPLEGTKEGEKANVYTDTAGGSRLMIDSYWWYTKSETRTEAAYYDISFKTAPKLLHTVGQDGYYLNSRLNDGVLYLMSNYGIYETAAADQPATYIPRTYDGDVAAILPAGNICCLPRIQSKQYLVVSSFGAKDGTHIGSSSVLGGGDTVYMSHDNLYVGKTIYEETAADLEEKEGNYIVTHHTSGNYTDLMRFALKDGKLELAATNRIEGALLNQFSLDEYEGNLRLVTTVNYNEYETLREEGSTGGLYRDLPDSRRNYNNLLILNADLEEVGSIKELAEGEQVYSVRFDGTTGYFVTFRQVDPLFTVDLSDPKAPVILSALKIPGFSQYLHPYSEGLLFGLGMDADEKTGRTNGMKMTMFNVSNPADVTEQHTLLLDTYWSEALYNHKAILVSESRDLIAFPSDNGFLIYGYSEENGFYERGKLVLGHEYWKDLYNSRCFYIGDCFYICGMGSTYVFSLSDFTQLVRVEY